MTEETREPDTEEPVADAAEEAVEETPAAAEAAEPEAEPDWQDRYLRVSADLQNMRKRLDQDVEDRVGLRLEALLHDLIRVSDYMDAALGSVPEEVRALEQAPPFLAGLEAIRQALEGVLLGHGMVFLAPAEDAEFDPEQHEAVESEEVEGLEAPRLELLSRGYRLGRRILRPAKVRLKTPAPQ